MAGRISVIIPTHNRALLLRSAIESVLASPLIDEQHDVIVVDDGSTDETAAVAARYGVRYVRVEAGGPSGARNEGLALADREFVAFLDDDDVWLPGNMAPQLQALLAAPSAAFAYGRVVRTNSELEPFGSAMPEPPLPSGKIAAFLVRNNVQLGAVLFRTAKVVEACGFDPAMRYSEDGDLMLRLAASHGGVGVDHVGSLFRQRDANPQDSEHRWRAHKAYADAMRKWRTLGLLPEWRVLIGAQKHYRGMASFWFCEDARLAFREGRRREALRWLSYALRISAPHSLIGHRAFWSALASIVQPTNTVRAKRSAGNGVRR